MAFRYLKDPLFLACLGLYFANRWLLKPLFPGGFFHAYLNDLICIPFWVPIMLWLMRKTRLRADDAPPQWYEILLPLLVWSAAFELVVPGLGSFRRVAVADARDILAYTVGALLSALFWKAWYRPRRCQPAGTTIS
jgi:hypothetical protein